MKKLGRILNDDVLVSMTKQEFKKLTKLEYSTPDGTEIDSDWLQTLIQLVEDNESTMKKIKKECEDLAENIGKVV